MTRRSVVALALVLTASAALAQGEPSVEVTVTRVEKASVPRVLTVYGTVEAGASARQSVTAPLSATIGDIEVREGQQVAKDAPLLRLTPSPQTAASYAEAQSALSVAKALVERTRTLLGQHLATQQQLAEAEKSRSSAAASLTALEAEGADGPHVLKAPFDSIVTAIAARRGAIVAEGAALVDLTRLSDLVLRAGVMPERIAEVKPGDPVSVTPIGTHRALAGKVLLRGAMVDPGNGLVAVEITLPANQVLPGETAAAAITTGDVAGYVVPHQAILVDERGNPYVVQVIGDAAKIVAVQLLGKGNGKDVVEGPLDATAPLVLTGNHQLQDGMKVRLADPHGKP
jgi:membrane fusion protein (multidrug efflux system)